MPHSTTPGADFPAGEELRSSSNISSDVQAEVVDVDIIEPLDLVGFGSPAGMPEAPRIEAAARRGVESPPAERDAPLCSSKRAQPSRPLDTAAMSGVRLLGAIMPGATLSISAPFASASLMASRLPSVAAEIRSHSLVCTNSATLRRPVSVDGGGADAGGGGVVGGGWGGGWGGRGH